MRFKTSSKKIMCIRTTYDAGAGRGVDKTVISIDVWAKSIPEDAKALLDEAEQQQLQAFLDERQAASDKVLSRVALTDLGNTLKKAQRALEAPETLGRSLSDEEVAVIWGGLDAMRLAMKRAGYPRPKATAGEGTE